MTEYRMFRVFKNEPCYLKDAGSEFVYTYSKREAAILSRKDVLKYFKQLRNNPEEIWGFEGVRK